MIDFPNSPTTGQIYNSGTGPIYVWDGVAWNLVATTPPPQAWELIANKQITAQSSIPFPDLAPFLKLRASGMFMLSAASGINYQVSSDNGVTYDGGASDYTYEILTVNGASVTSGGAVVSVLGPVSGISALAGSSSSFSLTFEMFNYAGLVSRSMADASTGISGGVAITKTTSYRNDTKALNALRLYCGSGTFTGNVLLEGVRG